jgi:hypothetical protein
MSRFANQTTRPADPPFAVLVTTPHETRIVRRAATGRTAAAIALRFQDDEGARNGWRFWSAPLWVRETSDQ